jgi:hypothetical protein
MGTDKVYRVFEIGRDGHIHRPPTVLAFRSDKAAIAFAKRRLDGLDIEVWQDKRLVARLAHRDEG